MSTLPRPEAVSRRPTNRAFLRGGSPRDPANATFFYEEKRMTIIHDSIDPIAKGTWSPNGGETPAWHAGFQRYAASKLCQILMMLVAVNPLLPCTLTPERMMLIGDREQKGAPTSPGCRPGAQERLDPRRRPRHHGHRHRPLGALGAPRLDLQDLVALLWPSAQLVHTGGIRSDDGQVGVARLGGCVRVWTPVRREAEGSLSGQQEAWSPQQGGAGRIKGDVALAGHAAVHGVEGRGDGVGELALRPSEGVEGAN